MSKQSSLQAILSSLDLSVSWSRMNQNVKNPHSAPFRKASMKVALNDPIKGHKTYVLGIKPKKDHTYIQYDKSVRALVKDNLDELEYNYFIHTFAMSSYARAAEGVAKRMKRYFEKDKLGLKDIPTTDMVCSSHRR